MTWKLGGCPRCHGDLYLERELVGRGIVADYQESWVCLQCGGRTPVISQKPILRPRRPKLTTRTV